ncbi:MAG: tRNA dihydrouridine synthase DusB [Parachlamydiales bacterium]|jgi:nifR3 family TIM-barrel protein
MKKNLSDPIAIGRKILPNRVFYAPLAGCSDFPFRKMSARYQPGLMFCEMVKMDAIIRNDYKTFRLLDFSTDMHPIGGQICGSKPQIAGQAARIIEDLGFDTVDLNCGCPVDKVTKDGSGSGMLKNPKLIGDVVSAMAASVSIPVTIKIRAGWDEDSINCAEIAKIAYEAGAHAITVHGRTRQQGYRGPANWDHIRAVREAAPNMVVIGNGDVFSPRAALDMVERTGCDAILVARGTMGAPWIAQDILQFERGEEIPVRGVDDIRQALYRHFEYTLKHQSLRHAILDMRRVGCWYFKKAAGTKSFREQMSHATDAGVIRKLILEYPFEIADDACEDGSCDE